MSKSKFLSLFLLIAAVPVLVAFVLLKTGWYHAGVNNKGTWYQQEIHLLPAIEAKQAHWRLVYLRPAVCDAVCKSVEHLMKQIHAALGRKQQQLDLVVLTSERVEEQAEGPAIRYLQSSFAGLPVGSLIIVEQQGLALLHYKLPGDIQHFPLLGKDVMADLQKLFKFDRGPV